ncbi:MAG: glycosyltransferase [Thermoleophilaceae bacterium]|nr:glycosyltransferase [Thermoleophilaceae bacterium]
MASKLSRPELAVVVATHDRPARLARLLDALAGQTIDAELFEVVVAHHGDAATLALIEGHPLQTAGRLRQVDVGQTNRGPAAKRNAGWRAARASTIAFTDDDCRPPPGWLESLLAAVRRDRGAIVQGATRPDPEEAGILDRSPRARTLSVEPPTAWGQTANIAYPQSLLARLGGFDEDFRDPGGEDADLLFRAVGTGATHVAAREAVTYHAVEDLTVWDHVRIATRWSGPVLLVKRHPQFRGHAVLGVFWRARHAWLALALVGLLLGGRRRPLGLLALPYLLLTRPDGYDSPRRRLLALRLLPGTALIDATEIITLARASARYRTLFL